MATTTITQPNSFLQSVNDWYDSTYIFSNTGYTQSNFRYIADVYIQPQVGATAVYLTENIFPSRNDGNGYYSPYNALLANLNYDLNVGATQGVNAWNSELYYYINYGHEFNPNSNITAVYEVGVPYPHHFGFDLDTGSSMYDVGDTIFIQSQNPYYNGSSTVTQVNSFSPNLVIDTVFNALGTYSTGTIIDCKRIEGSCPPFLSFNGTRQYANQSDYTPIYNNAYGYIRSFLSDYNNIITVTQSAHYYNPTGKLVQPNQNETIGCFFNYLSGTFSDWNVAFRAYNLSGSLIFATTTMPLNNTYTNGAGVYRVDIPCGPAQLAVAFPTLAYYFNNNLVSAYYFYLQSEDGTSLYGHQASEIRSYVMNYSCSLYTNVRVMFMNRLGSFDYWNFQLDNKKTYNINRTEMRKELPFFYNIGDRNRTILSQRIVDQHIINTNWINETDYAYLAELVTSPEVYIINESNLNAIPIIITDTSYEFKTAYRDKLFNLTVTYEHSADVETQRQ